MTELLLYPWLVRGVFVAAALTFLALTFVVAPYGRHTRPGWGPTIAARTGWLWMEGPAPVVYLLVHALGRHRADPLPILFFLLWQAHYVWRAFVYPMRLRDPLRPMPAMVAALGGTFNVVNAYLNARWVSEIQRFREPWLQPALVAGVILFVLGLAVNHVSDARLRALRAPGEHGYKVPTGGLHRWISCPNYLGEIVEWAGWALATRSPAALAFAVYTAANLVPRAVAHHRWYRATFPDYPRDRRALVPFVL